MARQARPAGRTRTESERVLAKPLTERLQRGIEFARGPWNFDGFSQLYFDQVRQADHAFTDSALAAELIADENHFLGELHNPVNPCFPINRRSAGRLT